MLSPQCHRNHLQSIMSRTRYKRQRRLLYRSIRSTRILPRPQRRQLCQLPQRSQRPLSLRPWLHSSSNSRPTTWLSSSSNSTRYVSERTSLYPLNVSVTVSVSTVSVCTFRACLCVNSYLCLTSLNVCLSFWFYSRTHAHTHSHTHTPQTDCCASKQTTRTFNELRTLHSFRLLYFSLIYLYFVLFRACFNNFTLTRTQCVCLCVCVCKCICIYIYVSVPARVHIL